uniref:Uncharacterized protein n=1 Tax=Plectus sambesii TaxID=2011161 RepID=A0A914VQC7_9BILA
MVPEEITPAETAPPTMDHSEMLSTMTPEIDDQLTTVVTEETVANTEAPMVTEETVANTEAPVVTEETVEAPEENTPEDEATTMAEPPLTAPPWP